MWAGHNISLDLVWSWTPSTWVLVCSELCIIHSCNAPGEFQELSTPKSVANIIQYHLFNMFNINQYYTYKWYKNQYIYIYTHRSGCYEHITYLVYTVFSWESTPQISTIVASLRNDDLQVFASLMEHQHLPIFAAQFHPATGPFSDADGKRPGLRVPLVVP
jgi:hypothetical protein